MNQEQIEDYLDKMLNEANREIDKVFAARLKVILDHLRKIHEKFNIGEEAQRTEVYNTKRFEREMELIKQNIHNDYKQIYKEIDKLMQSQYVENYLRSAYVYEMSQAMNMSYNIPSTETVVQAITNPIAELTLSTLMNKHRNEIVSRIRLELAQGIQAGESYSVMAERLRNTVGFSRNKARTVAVTEAGRTQVLGRLESGEHAQQYANLDKYWLSSRDTSVRHAHRKLDGDKANKDGYFTYQGHKAKGPSLFGVARLDIRCRCDVIYMKNGQRPEVMRVRDYDDNSYQQRLADRIDELITEGLTEKQATKRAKKEIYPPSKVVEFQDYDTWYNSLLNKG